MTSITIRKNDRAPASPPPPPTIFKWGENDSFHFMKMLDDAYADCQMEKEPIHVTVWKEWKIFHRRNDTAS